MPYLFFILFPLPPNITPIHFIRGQLVPLHLMPRLTTRLPSYHLVSQNSNAIWKGFQNFFPSHPHSFNYLYCVSTPVYKLQCTKSLSIIRCFQNALRQTWILIHYPSTFQVCCYMSFIAHNHQFQSSQSSSRSIKIC